MTMTYRGCTLTRTDTTTETVRYAWGRQYRTMANLWNISGRLSKTHAGSSAAQCREWIREQDELAEIRAETEREERRRAEVDRHLEPCIEGE